MDNDTSRGMSRRRAKAAGLGLVAAGAVAGGVLASTLSASAADTANTSPPTAYSYGAPAQGHGQRPGPGAPMGNGHGPNETILTGSDAAKAKAAALQAVPGGTVDRVETDSGDAVYEAHMTKADGTLVTVKMDKNFSVTAIEDGMGK